MEIKEIFVANLKKYRKLRGFSQSDLAKETGYSLGFIGDLERGNSWVSPEAIENISKALKISVSVLFSTGEMLVIDTPASKTLKKMQMIPDDIYDLAVKIDGEERIWEAVRGTIRGQLKVREMRMEKKDQA